MRNASVVPAKAGTHTPCPLRCGTTDETLNARWVWVPTLPGRQAPILRASRGRPCLLQVIIALHRRHHQEAVALRHDALAIAGLDMRVANDDVVLLAGVDDALHPF